MSLADTVETVLATHKPGTFCCYSDRAPCVLAKDQEHLCGVITCKLCAPSPREHSQPLWPCAPRVLAEHVKGTL